MKSIYNAQTDKLEEQPEMPEPNPDDRPRGDNAVWDAEEWRQKWVAYREHIASLRHLNTQEGHSFEAGIEYVEGKDYAVKEVRTWGNHPAYGWGCAECCNGDRCNEDCMAVYSRKNCPYCKGSGWHKEKPFFAIPIQKEDDRDYMEACVFTALAGTSLNDSERSMVAQTVIDFLLEKFAITLKQSDK